MHPRLLSLHRIIEVLVSLGSAQAFAATRLAYESGALSDLDLPEVMLAVQARSVSRLNEIALSRPVRSGASPATS